MWKHPNTLRMHVHLNLTGSELQNKGCLIVTYPDPRLSNAVQDYIIIIICTTNCNLSWFSMGKYTHTQCASGKHKLAVCWSISLLSWQLPHSQAPPSFPKGESLGESLGEPGRALPATWSEEDWSRSIHGNLLVVCTATDLQQQAAHNSVNCRQGLRRFK